MRTIGRAGPLALFALVSLAPLAASFAYAALHSVELAGWRAGGFTLEHWRDAWSDPETWRSIALSAWVASATSALSTTLGLAVALGFGARLDRGAGALALHLPLALPATAAALVAFHALGATGWLPRALHRLGIEGALDGRFGLVHDAWAVGVILTETLLAAPLLALTFRAVARSEHLDQLEAVAASLGAGRLAIAARVTLPVLLGGARPLLVLLFVAVLGAYEIPLLLGRSSPEMVSVRIARKLKSYDLGDRPEALALALTYALFVGLVIAASPLPFGAPRAGEGASEGRRARDRRAMGVGRRAKGAGP